MGLKNEAKSAFQNTKTFYREYVSDMTRERIGKEFYRDTDRLKQLYAEAIGQDIINREDTKIPAHVKMLRLFSALTERLSPTRRLLFGLSVIAFVAHYFLEIIQLSNLLFHNLLLPFAFGAVLILLLLELLEKSDVKREIDLAREIQLSLLPNTEFESENLEIYSFANTAREVGGDYVDIIPTTDGIYTIIADVSGKGLSAALYMVRMQALVRLLIKKSHPSPKELFLELNNYFQSSIQDKTFVTACVAFFPSNSDAFVFARAGHNAPIIYSNENDATLNLRTNGYALGMTSSQNLQEHLQEVEIDFKPGDSLLFYTDGLSEARNESGEEFGEVRLDAVLSIYGSLHAKTIIGKIQHSLEKFIGKEDPADDITFTCIHRNE